MNCISPNSAEQKRRAMLEDSLRLLHKQGYEDLYVNKASEGRLCLETGLPDKAMHPDIIATRPGCRGPLLGVVESPSDLGEDACGRRWQAFASWAKAHHGQLMVFVHQEDVVRAALIAKYWHLDPCILVPVGQAYH